MAKVKSSPLQKDKKKTNKMDKSDKTNKCRTQYSSSDIKSAVSKVKNGEMTLYGASHRFGVPWTTLKRYASAVGENEQFDIQKLGRPFAKCCN